MRKNKLIEMLQAMPGNPEVVLWNGYVSDWQPMGTPVQMELVKKDRAFLRTALNYERREDGREPISEEELNKVMAKREWDLPNQCVDPKDYPKWYGKARKRLIVLEAKRRGKSSFDRLGTMKY